MGVRRIFSRRGQNQDVGGGKTNLYIVFCPIFDFDGREEPKKYLIFQPFFPIFPSQRWANASSCLNMRTPMD